MHHRFRAPAAMDLRRLVALRRRRVGRRALAFAIVAAALLAMPAVSAARTTYVTLTFDDATADQLPALPILAAHGMHGTFYVPDGLIGNPQGGSYYMNWAEVDQVAAAGHEIAGHTINHVDLATKTPAEQVQEVCGDRQALLARGYNVTNFAYPYAKWNASARAAVQNCGYDSGRGVGNVACVPGCPAAESVPPLDPYVLRSIPAVDTTSVDDVKSWVTRAEQNGGGWLIVNFHNICDGCNSNDFSPAKMNAVLDWLQAEQSTQNLRVVTVAEAMQLPPYAPPPNMLQNESLESGLSPAGPTCWVRSSYAGPSNGGNVGAWSDSSDSHSGANAEQISMSSFVDGDQKLASGQDTLAPLPTWKSPPTIPSATGGNLAAGTYYYKVTATTPSGETPATAEVSATVSGTKSSINVKWNAVGGVTGYNVYRTSTSGQETLLASVGTSVSPNFLDTGAGTPGTRVPPTVNTAARGTCSPAGTPGHVYQVSAWYKTSATANTRMISYYRDQNGVWQFWREQPLPPSTSWSQATWTTPQLPAGATALSAGFSLRSVGTAVVDDLLMGDISG